MNPVSYFAQEAPTATMIIAIVMAWILRSYGVLAGILVAIAIIAAIIAIYMAEVRAMSRQQVLSNLNRAVIGAGRGATCNCNARTNDREARALLDLINKS